MRETLRGIAPLVASPPAFDATRAEHIAAQRFGELGAATELGGERDQNFRIDTDDGRYVLKISNHTDGPETLDVQAEALRHISRTAPDLPVMQPVPTVEGNPWTAVEMDGETHLIRLFTFLPGGSPSGGTLDEDALYEYGGTVARVGRALRGFFHPDARYEVLWDLRYTSDLRELIYAIKDDQRRALAERVLDRFDDRVAPSFESLRAQVIHNDLTLDNVLFDEGKVSGIVDFGDLTHTALVSDLAIALASVMHRCTDPFDAARHVIRGYVEITPLTDSEARILGDLVAARLLSWGVIVAWRSVEHPEKTDHTTTGVEDGWALLQSLERTGLDVVGRRLRTAALSSNVPYPRMEQSELLSRRQTVMGDSPLFYCDPVHFVGGEGVWLFDSAGRRYLDAYNNVQVVGHGNARVADAVGGQVSKLTTNTRYLHEAVVTLSERLLETLPDGLDRVMFVNSGSEANDLAWRLAAAATGRDGAVVSEHAYHGITDATVALSPADWPRKTRPDHVETVPPPARSHHRGAQPSGAEAMTAALDRLGRRGYDPAAFVFDPLFTSDGIFPPNSERLTAMAGRIHDLDGLIIADEVQAGYGRTGSNLWGFQATDVVPDIVTMGKPMGNGHPVAAVATRSDIASVLMDRTGMFSTFGGNPVSCAAALAVMDVIEDEGLLAQTREVGAYLHDGLVDMSTRYDVIGDVRREGTMVGVELVSDEDDWTPATDTAKDVVEGLRRRRVLIGSSGSSDNVLKIRPPLVFERDHADRLLGVLDSVLETECDG
ncbi:aminotransferase class III-fold pyridoxal phosphate-dependent enzyme [Natronomonas sp.]|uniref:aminotransferase class III-fold pyridoxal phosphate-dependent enzyme n=1 Tax=Natronomonas sp. TaxID=2184060 RepID=UPI003974D88B